MNEKPFDPKAAELFELDTLLERGTYFTVPKRSLLRYLGKPDRRFEITQPYLGTLHELSKLGLEMEFFEEVLKQDPLGESKRQVAINAKRCARAVAIAVLNNKFGIELFSGALANYFLWRITPQKLFQLTVLINEVSGIGNFINAIRYLNATPRTSSPNLIAERRGEED